MKYITRTVWILSVVSLFTDIASEMLYPVMPLYLKSIGFSVLMIGILEGIAEAVAGLSKGYFGKLSDASGKRLPFVQVGYALSTLSKPMMAIFVQPVWVLFARTMDRLGKGIRTGARDAILSDESSSANKGKVFGFHRAMDTAGAAIGPALALGYLYLYPGQYRNLFFIAFIPGVIAVVLSFFIREKKIKAEPKHGRVSFFSFIQYWKQGPVEYRRLVIGLLAFALINSSDVFLLLKARESGLSDSGVIGVYIFYNLVYAIFAFPMGVLADRLGLKNIFLFGILLFAAVYCTMSWTMHATLFYFLFFLYGIYAASTEGISKAWITNISARKDTATAVGTYSGFQSICAMIASSATGLLWLVAGSKVTFLVLGTGAVLVFIYFILAVKKPTGTMVQETS